MALEIAFPPTAAATKGIAISCQQQQQQEQQRQQQKQ